MATTFENIMDRVEHCYTAKPCVECKYDKRDFPHCVGRLLSDVRFFYKELESRLAQVKRERDAAVRDLEELTGRVSSLHLDCDYCKDKEKPICNNCKWEWRGICEENSKEENNG